MNYVFICHDREPLPPRFFAPVWKTVEFRWDRDLRNEGKWKNIRLMLHAHNYSDGEYFWFPDPDMEFDFALPVLLFAAMKSYKLDIAQPALTESSVASHSHLRAQDTVGPRRVPHIEIGVPCFSMAALRRNLWTFGLNYSGFGIDLLWGKHEQCYVLDWLQVHHPSSPGYHNTAREHGLPDPRRELDEVRRLYL